MNAYPECRRCGSCCSLNVLCMTEADFRAIARYAAEQGVQPRDYAKARCCFQDEDNTCMVWEARPQVCRLHSCVEPRELVRELLAFDIRHRLMPMTPAASALAQTRFRLGIGGKSHHRPRHKIQSLSTDTTRKGMA